MALLARPLSEWPSPALMARARVLLLYLDPDRLNPPKRRLKKIYWEEMRRILTELDMRGMQGKLL